MSCPISYQPHDKTGLTRKIIALVHKSTHFTTEQLRIKQRHVYMKMQFMIKVEFKISWEMTDYSTISIGTSIWGKDVSKSFHTQK